MHWEQLIAAMHRWQIKKSELAAFFAMSESMERNWRSGRWSVPKYVAVFFEALDVMGDEKGRQFLEHLRTEIAENA